MGLLEASACALPIVATNVPGSWEVVVHGYSGLLSGAGDVSALAAAMTHLMQTPPGERRAMGERARQMVIERFDLEHILGRWETLYQTLLMKNQSPVRWARSF